MTGAQQNRPGSRENLQFPPGEKGKATRSFPDQVSRSNLQISRPGCSQLCLEKGSEPRNGGNAARSTTACTQTSSAPPFLFLTLGLDPTIPPNSMKALGSASGHIKKVPPCRDPPPVPSSSSQHAQEVHFMPK